VEEPIFVLKSNAELKLNKADMRALLLTKSRDAADKLLVNVEKEQARQQAQEQTRGHQGQAAAAGEVNRGVCLHSCLVSGGCQA
jgi:hypothetical protein